MANANHSGARQSDAGSASRTIAQECTFRAITTAATFHLLGLFFAASAPAALAQPATAPGPAGPAQAATALAQQPVLSVIGFECAPGTDERDRWIAVALEELLARRLERVPGLRVIPTVRMVQGRNEIQDPDGKVRPWPEVASAMGATAWLSGTCSGTDLETRLRLTLMSPLMGERAPQQVELAGGRLFGVLDEAFVWVLEQLSRSSLDPELRRRLLRAPSESVTAIEYYARAVASLRDGQTADAYRYAGQAVSRDKLLRPALLLQAQIEFSQRTLEGQTRARRLLRTVADLARLEEDPIDRVRAEIGLALLVQAEGGFEAACLRLENALALAYEHDDYYGQLAAITAMSDLYLLRPLRREAEMTLDEQHRFAQRSVNWAAEWHALLLAMLAEQHDTLAGISAANKYAVILEQLDRPDEARRMHRRTLELAEQLRCTAHQATAWLYLGQWYRKQKQWAEALDAITRCLALAEPASKSGVRIVLGEVYRGMELYDEAASQFALALEELRRGEDLPRQLTCLRELAALQYERGRHAEAMSLLQEAVDVAHALESPEEKLLRQQLEQWRAPTRP